MNLEGKIVVISGPTASGKTNYSIALAKQHNGVVINADSMQVYKGLPVLSAQPSEEEKSGVEHLLFSYLEPTDNCDVGLWLELAKDKIDYCLKAGKTPLIVGGTGMYLSKLINGISQIPKIPSNIRRDVSEMYLTSKPGEFYQMALDIDKDYVKTLSVNDRQRLTRVVEIFRTTGHNCTFFRSTGVKTLYARNRFFHININPPREIVYQKCIDRFKKMVYEQNVIDEVRNFLIKNESVARNPEKYSITKTLCFAEIVAHINNHLDIKTLIDESVKITRHYAKRQYTWFNHQFDSFDLRLCSI